MSEQANDPERDAFDELEAAAKAGTLPPDAPGADDSDGDAPPTDKPKPDKKAKEPEGVKLSRKDHDALLKRIAELEASERYWAERAAPKGKPEPEPAPEPEPEPEEEDDPDQFVTDLTKSGVKALLKRGVITKKLAVEIAQREARKVAEELVRGTEKRMSTDAKLVHQFPDLQDRDSELFRRTSPVYTGLIEEYPDMPKHAALFVAARIAKAELAAERGTRGDGDRDARIRAQSGDRGQRSRDPDDEDNNSLGPEARQVIAAMRVTESDYRRYMPRKGGR